MSCLKKSILSAKNPEPLRVAVNSSVNSSRSSGLRVTLMTVDVFVPAGNVAVLVDGSLSS